MNKEIEIKFSLNMEDHNTFLEWLEVNAKLQKEKYQKDIYFDNPKASFITITDDNIKDATDYLRIRTSGSDFSMCLKSWHEDKDNPLDNWCDEFEIKISDFLTAHQLLSKLGFQECLIVEKFRKIFSYKNFEIVCDQVTDLGNFIEIEYKQESLRTPKQIHNEIKNLLKEIGIKKYTQYTRGYVSMLWNKEYDFGVSVDLMN